MDAAGVAAHPFLGTGALLRALGDDRLVARVRAGDQRAFETIYDRHHRRLLAFCRHMLGNREEAEDVLQHTFAAAYRSLRNSDNDVQFKAWLFAIARNRCLSVLRARREQAELHDDVGPATDGLHRQVEQRADLRELLADMQELPDEQRAALVLSELGAHSHDEIAMILDVRKDKVKALVFQARESLATSRRARETPCHEIREQLATLRGGALRRAPIRRHVDTCAGCTAFRAEVQRQRAAMAIILPAAPSLALKSSVLGPLIGGSGIAAGIGVGAGVAEVAGSAAGAGSGITALGQGMAAKAVVAAAVVASVGGGGIAADELRERAVPHSDPQSRPAEPAGARVPGADAPAAPGVSRGERTGGGDESGTAPGSRRGLRTGGGDRTVELRKPRRRKPAVGTAPAAAAPLVLPPADGDERRKGREGKRGKGKGHKRQAAPPQPVAGGGKGGEAGRGDRGGAGGQQHAAASAPTPAPAERKNGAKHEQTVAPEQQAAAPVRDQSSAQAVAPENGSPAAQAVPAEQQAPAAASPQQPKPARRHGAGTAPAGGADGRRPAGRVRDDD